jgi:WD40 repeat protein
MSRILGQLGCMLILTFAVHGGDHHFVQSKTGSPRTDQNGDPLPEGALVRMGSLRWRHGQSVTFVAFTPDNKGVITMSRDNIIRLWDRETGKEIRRFEAKGAAVKQGDPLLVRPPSPLGSTTATILTMSPDSKTLAAIFTSNRIHLWDIETGNEIRQFQGPPGSGSVNLLLSPDGKKLAARTFDSSVHLFDTTTGKEVRQIKSRPTEAGAFRFVLNGRASTEAAGMAFSPDSKTLAISEMEVDKMKSSNFVRLSDVNTGEEIGKVNTTPTGASSIAYSPDGKVLAFVSASVLQVREADGGKELRKIVMPTGAGSIVISSDNKLVAVKGRDQVVRVYDLNTGDALHEFGNPVTAPAMNFNVNAFVIAGGATADARDLAFSPDGKVLITGSGQTVRFWNVVTGKEQSQNVGGHRGAVSSVAFSSDGKYMFSRGADDIVRRWDALTGKELSQFVEPKGTTSAAFSPDGKFAAFANIDSTTRLYSVADGKQLHQLQGHKNGVSAMAFSPDGASFATRGGADNTIRIFDVVKGTERKSIVLPGGNTPGPGVVVLRGGILAGGLPIAFSPDGQQLAAYLPAGQVANRGQSDAYVRVFDIHTGKEVREITLPIGRAILNLAYAPDGRVLAMENFDQTISLWEMASGWQRTIIGEPASAPVPQPNSGVAFTRLTGTFTGGINPEALAYSSDGELIAARGPANSVRVWQVSTGKEIGAFKGHHGGVLSLAFTADSKRLATCSYDTTILIWDVAALKRVPRVQNAQLQMNEIETMWTQLAAIDAARAVKCIDELATDARQVTPFLKERVKPAAPVDAALLDQWLADLGSINFQKRARATSELERLGPMAIPALKKLINTEITIETRRRAEAVLEKAITGILTPDQLRMVRAIESLEKMQTPAARDLLRSLASGAPGALQTRHAQAALDRLERR